MVEYLKAGKKDKQEIIDLINYVFSYDHRPHDFKALLPKAYSDEVDGMGAEHYIAKENGKITAVVAIRIIDIDYAGSIIKAGMVGSVAVHPYSRGKGYMKKLMKAAADDAKKAGVQMLLLSGKRQRYGYFGFENAGLVYNFNISAANIRHALRDVDDSEITFREMTAENPEEIKLACEMNNSKLCHTIRREEEFMRIMNSWSEKSYVIYKKGEMTGYSFGKLREWVLKDSSDYPAVMKAMLKNAENTYIPAGAYERDKIEFLSSICENYSLSHCEKISVLDWKAVVRALLGLKTKITRLSDGEASFAADNACFTISVKNNSAAVTDSAPDKNTVSLSHNGAERLFFELDGLAAGKFGNWFPLPLYIDPADRF